MDSEEDFYSSSGEDAAEDIAEFSADDAEDDGAAAEESSSITKKHYRILKEETLKQLQENDISEVCSILAVSRGIACTLLLRQRWSVSSVFEEWFADEGGVRNAVVGVSTEQKPKKDKTYCKICMEKVESDCTLSAGCGHLFCTDCWTRYVAVSISDGPGCLWLHCPEPKCEAMAGLDMVEAVAAADDKRRFYHYLYRSYVECSRSRKWCPGPSCEHAVELDSCGGEEIYSVTCDCRHKFCWSCMEEQHRPLDCETVAKWTEKNASEADNHTWILANTKSCPKCHKKIEKNQGCSHMTCTCDHQFCWLCLGIWKNEYRGHVCNKFHKDEEKARYDSLQAKREDMKKYAHYFERFMFNHKSMEIARADLVRADNELLPQLSKVHGHMPEAQLLFVTEAWYQIIECRRLLKWSYVLGYYLEREKREFFDFLQGQAEAALERLHHRTEKEMMQFLEPGSSSESFADFRVEVSDLTSVAKQHFESLITALENDSRSR